MCDKCTRPDHYESMTFSQWEAFDMSSGSAVAGSLKYVPDPPAPTRPAITVVAPPPAAPSAPSTPSTVGPFVIPTPPPQPVVQQPAAAAHPEAPKGHHFLVYVGMALMAMALGARIGDGLLQLDLLATASFRVMALGAVVFVLGRMIRLEIH